MNIETALWMAAFVASFIAQRWMFSGLLLVAVLIYLCPRK